MSDAFITKYRPQSLDQIIGHESAVRSIRTLIKNKGSKTFLFTGPSGTGKTTLARIIAKDVGCLPSDLLEIDGATYSGVDEMRAVTASLIYKPIGEGSVKAIIVDEFHAISKASVQALLKILEDPPSFVYWFLCTTESARVPTNIRTRCTCYDLKPVSTDDLLTLLDSVVEKEKLGTQEKIVDLCALEAQGSPRQALANLAVCVGAKNLKEAQELLRSATSSEEAVNLARALIQGKGWGDVQKLLTGLKDTNPESIRHVVRAYVSTVILGAKTEQAAGRGIEILDAFSEPFNSGDGISPVILACGKVLLG